MVLYYKTYLRMYKMKRIERFILESCSISVLITSIFFVFAKISAPETVPALHIGRYFLILLFGFLIIGANSLFGIKKLNKFLALLIHFFVSFVAFLLIFVNFDGMNAMRFFIHTVLFAIFYVIIFAIVIGIKRLVGKLDEGLGKKQKTNNKSTEYTPRYK